VPHLQGAWGDQAGNGSTVNRSLVIVVSFSAPPDHKKPKRTGRASQPCSYPTGSYASTVRTLS
jgi:hypothetical protein